MVFRDRIEAGRKLAEALSHLRGEDLIVLGLPRGGVPVAYEVARALDAPLDVAVARKLGAPMQPELGIGAIAPGVSVIDENSLALLGLKDEDLQPVVEDETRELHRRLLIYRGIDRLPDVHGRYVVLVDDGIATGVTTRAATRSLRRLHPARLLLAVPVGAPESVAALRHEVDELVCLHEPPLFHAVGAWYEDFSQTSDQEVLEYLARRRIERGEEPTAAAP
ncbi:phosphoribosyltransferase [Vulgatibacter sp.]|uniref:phosphoribosyltransferase n=1 Tax=Vulgatibacter sp. TaxID=1971226 RepID=UPI00356B0A45